MTRVALVTGGAVRVGRAITLGLADAGFDVAINYHNSEAQAQDVARNVEAKGKRAIAVRGDISDKQDIDRLVDSVRSEYGRLDLLVNNASVFLSTPFLEVDEAEWDRVMAVNLKGPFLLTQATSNLLAVSRGHVINIVDLSAFQPWMSYPHHSVSKAGLLHLTRLAAQALAPEVRVNAIAPGAVLPPEDYAEKRIEEVRRSAALETWGSPDDVVRTVLFLDGSPFITGEVIVVDGGRLGAR